ncbi:MAG: transposase [Anaerolineae bacterium]|nr:transposase [Anaerolineae bacterium]
MPYDSLKYHRRSVRLQGYDYAQSGAYFVTVCTHNRECLFGEIVAEAMVLNPFGIIVQDQWDNLPRHYPHLELDAFVVMPNHMHGIIVLTDPVGAGLRPAPTTVPTIDKRYGLPEIVRALKAFSARQINDCRESPGVPVWQRNYYEHIIRNEKALDAIRRYIEDNPLRWALDVDNPVNLDNNRRRGS